MVLPASSTPTRRREGVWRDPHHGSSAPYSYDYEVMPPSPYSSNRGPPPLASYHYDSQTPPTRGPPGAPPSDYWQSPPPYSSEHQHPPLPLSHRGGGGPYWTPPPPPSYDGYRNLGSLRGLPHGSMPHTPHHHRTPSRRLYSGDQQVGLEPRFPPPSPGNRHIYHHSHQRRDFNPPAPATAPPVQEPASRAVQVAVSASADSEETPQTNKTRVSTASPKKEGVLDNDDNAAMDDDSDSKAVKKENGDPLSVLADVSAGLGGKNKGRKQEKDTGETKAIVTKGGVDNDLNTSRPPVHMPAPTSPLQRRLKPSPITPSQTPQVTKISNKGTPAKSKHQPITPSRSHDTASTTEGVSQSLQPSWEAPPLPHGGSGGSGTADLYSSQSQYNGTLPQSNGPYNSPSRRSRPGMHYGSEFGPPFPTDLPALVERGSFDSHGDASSYRGGAPIYPPTTPTSSRGAYFYDDHPPPPLPPGYGNSGSGGPYWDLGQPPHSPTYPPPNRGGGWNQSYPPPPLSDSMYGPPPHHGSPPDYSYPPPPPHYGVHEDHDVAMYGGNLPPHLSYHHRGGPPPPMPGPHHPGMSMHPHHMGGPSPPYSYGHPPRIEEKTILRKKFSWKHYPEVRTKSPSIFMHLFPVTFFCLTMYYFLIIFRVC